MKFKCEYLASNSAQFLCKMKTEEDREKLLLNEYK